MITPETAKESYGFFDASEQEDALTTAIIKHVQCSFNQVLISFFSLIIVIVVAAGLTTYQLHSGFSPALTVISIVLIVIYFPKVIQTWKKHKESSSIRLESSEKKPHFLLCHASCMKKNEVNNNIYSLKVKTANGMILDDVVVPKSFYGELQEKEALFVTFPVSETATQLIGIPCAFVKEQESHIPKELTVSDYFRPITTNEITMIQNQYQERTKLRQHLYLHNYLVILAAGCVGAIAGIVVNSATLLYPSLFVIVLILGALFMYYDEDRRFLKNLTTDEDNHCIDAYVSNIIPKTGDLEFSCSANGKPAYLSKKREDISRFKKGDQVLLVYLGKEKPIPFKK